MHYLESMKFVHRDLAARNCLLDANMNVKVSDFGLTKQLMDKNYYYPKRPINEKCPSLGWLSKVLNGENTSSKSDVWSYGVVLWELMSGGDKPFKEFTKSMTDVIHLVFLLKNGYRLIKPKDCPKNIYEICLKCWQKETKMRPNFNQILYLFQNLQIDVN